MNVIIGNYSPIMQHVKHMPAARNSSRGIEQNLVLLGLTKTYISGASTKKTHMRSRMRLIKRKSSNNLK